MNKSVSSSATSKNISKISKALFVLSQLATKRKVEIYAIKDQISLGSESEQDLIELQRKLEHLSKVQRYFHAERMEVMRYLIVSGLVDVKGYITESNCKYGLVKVGKYELYSILNNKLVEKLKLNQVGTELTHFEPLPDEDREKIMTEKEAVKVFKLYLAKIRLKREKKAKEKTEKTTIASKDVVLSKSVSATGNIVVIKKRKFSNLAAANKPTA